MKSRWWVVGLILALAVVLLSPLASPEPDGLERVAEDQGFIDRALEPFYEVLPDYTVPVLGESSLSTIVAGLIGTVLVFVVSFGAANILKKRAG